MFKGHNCKTATWVHTMWNASNNTQKFYW